MNIEEAIKILDKLTTEHKLFNIKHSDGLEEAIETLLIAYENSQLEIESLKEDKEIIKRNYEDLVDENEKFLYDSAVYLMGKDDTNSKWEDKIKAKIEELKVLAEKADDETLNCCELDIRKNQIYLLQSLLEKE